MTSPTPPSQAPRVVSLLPAATEIVCALGFQRALVGVSHECDFPPGVRGLPVMTRSKVITRGTSAQIDADVRMLLRSALGVYDLCIDELRNAAPDVIVTQDLCDVCAVPFETVQRAAREVFPGATLVNLHPTRLADLYSDVRKVAAALGCVDRGELWVEGAARHFAEISARARRLARRPNVLTIEWLDPIMVGGTWMPELVEIAGGRALLAAAGSPASTVTRAQLAVLEPAPDVVVLKPCGFGLERSFAEWETLRAWLREMPWPALRGGGVFLADGNAYFNRPGPRLVDSARMLAAMFHPAAFADFGAELRSGFVRLAVH